MLNSVESYILKASCLLRYSFGYWYCEILGRLFNSILGKLLFYLLRCLLHVDRQSSLHLDILDIAVR